MSLTRTLQISTLVLAAALAAGCSTVSAVGDTVGSKMRAMMGKDAPAKTVDGVLVNANGMSLYTFDRDAAAPGKSVCNGPCATNWPPLAAAADAKASGDWSVVTRDDGAKQWAYKGKPVYTWIKDMKAGDRTGDGFNSVWHLARP